MSAALRALTVIVVFVIAGTACRSETKSASSPPATPTSAQRVAAPPASPAIEPVDPVVQFTPPPRAYTGPLPPLPPVSYPLPRSPEVVQAVYTFAARHPEVLHYVPCFCGCQRSGHKDNDDCFIKGRDAKGRPEWEAHGMG
jgi:hypothetical protein